MKKVLIGFMGVFLLFISCTKESNNKKHYSNGKLTTKEVILDEFSGILVDAKAEVILKQASKQKVTLTISENIFDDVDTKVINGIWELDFKEDQIATINKHQFTVIIESPSLSSIQMESTGSIKNIASLTNSPLTIHHNSSGTVQVSCKTTKLLVNMNGSGKLTLDGIAEEVNINHDSSGEIKAFSLNTKNCNLQKDGSGITEIFVTDKLTITHEGSGNIFYRGTPKIESTLNGSGDLINVN